MTNSESIFSAYPDPETILETYNAAKENKVPEINGHIHTPHSFSAFTSIEQAFQLAQTEGVSVLGINDFYTTDGYNEFTSRAAEYRIFPLYNIEFMALQEHLQEAGIRVNDPSNPGRTYFSGKGLRQPVSMSSESEQKIRMLQAESNRQTYLMVDRLNAFMNENRIDLHFDAGQIHKELARNLFRERHIAQAVRLAVFEKEKIPARRQELLKRIFSGREIKSAIDQIAALENEIRGNLLKAGGAAFVPEDPKAFLSLNEVIDIIVDAGGIPCYPVLLDFGKGNFTDYEASKEKLRDELLKNNVYAVELIPGRNDYRILKDFVDYFYRNDFIVTFGTEHNTPQLDPMKIYCGGGTEPDEELKKINYEGTAVIAAHQYLTAKGKEGYLSGLKAKTGRREEYAQLGKAVINWFLKQ